MKKKTIMMWSILLFIPFSFSLYGEVFSLWPFRNSSAVSAFAADSLFQREKLPEETVVINGRQTSLSTSIVNGNIQEALRTLKRRFPKGSAAMNENGLLFSTPPEKGWIRKILIVNPDGMGKGVMFSMTVPEKGFQKNPSWPHTLPFPAGAKIENVITFPQRRSVYGQLSSTMSKEELLSNIAMQLKAEGWVSPSNESGIPGGSGEVMLSADGKEIMIIGITPVKNSMFTHVSMYRRRLN